MTTDTAVVARGALALPTAATTHPPRLRGLRHTLVLAKRGLIKTIHTPEALIDVTLQPIIFLAMFTYIFGGAIAHGSQHSYLEFLLPGILGQTIAMGGVAIGVNLNTDIATGIFDRFRSLPIARSAPLVAAVLADVVRYVVLCAVTLGFGYVLGFRAHTGVLDVLAACVLATGFALCLCWASVFVGMIARTSGSVQGILTMIVLPLSFGSNTFVRTSTMPGWLQSFVKVNPLTHLVDAVRGLLLGGPVASDVLWTLAWMGILLAVFVPLALRAYRRRV
jgi:oleandomycin transport system permease protein